MEAAARTPPEMTGSSSDAGGDDEPRDIRATTDRVAEDSEDAQTSAQEQSVESRESEDAESDASASEDEDASGSAEESAEMSDTEMEAPTDTATTDTREESEETAEAAAEAQAGDADADAEASAEEDREGSHSEDSARSAGSDNRNECDVVMESSSAIQTESLRASVSSASGVAEEQSMKRTTRSSTRSSEMASNASNSSAKESGSSAMRYSAYPTAPSTTQANAGFSAATPTPIRPIPGDPRFTASGIPANGPNGSGAFNPAPARMFEDPTASQAFYDPPQNTSGMVPTSTSMKSDVDMASSFESQWNASAPVPMQPEAKWNPDMPMHTPSATTPVSAPNGGDSSMTPPSFPARSLIPQRVDDHVFSFDPVMSAKLAQHAKSITNPNQAASFAIDVLRATSETRVGAHGWRVMPYQANEYEVLLQKGSIGLCMNMSVRMGCVTVTSFRRPDGGVIGPAEASGMIEIGDDLVAVDGFRIQSPEDFTKVVGRLKSLQPVLVRFRRRADIPISVTTHDPNGYRQGLRISMSGLDSPDVFTAGMWRLGVRYIAPSRWAAELHVDGGGIRRLGVFPTEREAAMMYNQYIARTYGSSAAQFMNPAGGSPAGMPVGGQHPNAMKPVVDPMRRRMLKAAFTNEQKEQLKAQIMVFKFTSTGGTIPNDLLARALKSVAHATLQESVEKKKKRTFKTPEVAPKVTKKKSKRGKKKKKYSDESDDDSDSDEDFVAPVPKSALPTRRSGRHIGKEKKSYVEKDNDLDLELSEDEKPAENAEEVEAPKGPQIDKIVGVRFHKESAEDDEVVMQFLIKWKDASYLHLDWLGTNDIEEFGLQAIMRMRRYMQKKHRDVEQARENVVIGEERDLSAYFNDSFLEVDRILDVKEVEEPEHVSPFNNHGAGRDGTPTMKTGKKYLVKWRDLSYVDCTWEWEDDLTDDRKIAAYHRYNHPPMLQNAHPAMFEDYRPEATTWAKYQESPVYNNQNTLRSYQLEGLNWLVFCWYNRRNCILADEMGLGKTVQATAILEHLRQREHIRGPFLVVAPLATLGNWKREIETWTSMNCVVYHDSEGGSDIRAFVREHEFHYPNEMFRRRNIYKFNVLVTSYQTLMMDAEYLETIRWRYVVIDEAHKLKNREAKLLQCLRSFSWDSCLLMTGTPLQNGVFELWCLLNFIEPDKFPSQQEFYDQYGELNTAEQVALLHEQLRPYMLRRVKEDVEKSIPPKEETIIDVELTTMQKKYYRAIFERNRSFLNMGAAGSVANLVNVEMELRKCCNHPFLIRGVEEKECMDLDEKQRARILIQASGKTVLLDKMLTKFRLEKKKVLIFSQFKIMLDVIEDMCQMRSYSIERMDGSVRGNSRQAAIDRFNNPDSDTFAFLLSTRAGGVGINLIAASVVILFDSDWNPQNDLQAVARCHRIGQTQSVSIYRLVTKKTYEAQMFDIASKKLGMHHAVFETGGVRNEFDGDDEGGNMMSLMSLDREKVEMMIRYGAYAIMGEDDEHDPENRAINEVDIDQLLSSSRTIRYDPTRSEGNKEGEGDDEGEGEDSAPKHPSQSTALSFSKATFTAETSDSTIDFNDEQFWEKVLGPKLVQQLMSKVHEGWLSSASKEDIKGFLRDLRDLAREVVQERQRGGTMADADQVMSILVELKVVGPILKGEVNVRTLAAEWLEVIERPKRRRNQDAESELMYLEFLDGAKMEPSPKTSRSGGNRRKSKGDRKREARIYSDEELEQDEDDEPSTPVPKRKRVKRPTESQGSKTGIHVVLRQSEDDEYEVSRVYSTVKKIQKQLPKTTASHAAKKSRPKSPSRCRRAIHDDDDDDIEDDESDFDGEEEREQSEDDEEQDPDVELEDELDEEDEEEEEEPVTRRRRTTPRRKSNGKATGKKNVARKIKLSIDPQVDEEMWCRVCFSDQGYDDDPIVQCERCAVAVHKYCYGIQKVPEGDTPWICDYCSESSVPASEAVCALCPLKRVPSAFKKTREGDWVHVVCALWAPGVQFSDVERMCDVKNVAQAVREMRGEQCARCKEKHGCIKCFRNSCLVHFHPLCGRESKGSYDMYMNDAGQLRAYCPKHRTRARDSS